MPFTFQHPYVFDDRFRKPVAYCCMEFAIHQPLKIYAGGLGFLAGSHLRAAYALRQNLVAVGILWKYGYYDQVRKSDQTMDMLFQEKGYGFLEQTGIRFTIEVSGHEVWVEVWYLRPEIFRTAPLFLLSTDVPENDYLSKTISHKLYDANPETTTAAAILLGVGTMKLFDYLDWQPALFHLNESHALPLAFYLYKRYLRIEEVQKRLVYTNHTPEQGGNRQMDYLLLEKMGFFCHVPIAEVKQLMGGNGPALHQTRCALRFAGRANGVSALHVTTLNTWFGEVPGMPPWQTITNAQDFDYWANKEMYEALQAGDTATVAALKAYAKKQLFELVADQNGEILDEKVFTLVFAKRFAGYKRPALLLSDPDRFHRLVTNEKRPIQIIWAGKPYPMDYTAIGVFDRIVHTCRQYRNCSTLVGYELQLSRWLKQGADGWLNVPRMRHEASGTSGMSAAMNGAVNISMPDGWFPEFARDKVNSFVIPPAPPDKADHEQDAIEANHLYNLLEQAILPMFYDDPQRWMSIVQQGMRDILPYFDSKRLAQEYYEKLYDPADSRVVQLMPAGQHAAAF
ncbi:alpha-glucan family phosphorylase [Paraflavitalea pollutisoli]|uniref:alpha-glucan family phosphorylase n=1 Tax=Paraflavitalea pollutisoli TaxID=3034143 RepID=UPI0023ED2602|nr:alpha-glucan family phosphorylase [Paraflavitalea sp. H1-2-19X]